MNTRITLLALVTALAGAGSPTLFASPETTLAVIYRVNTVQQDGTTVVRPGDSDTKVLGALGTPHERMAKDVWVYPNYHATNNKEANRRACSMLVITFENDRVASIALVNRRAAKIVANNLRINPDYLHDRLVAMK